MRCRGKAEEVKMRPRGKAERATEWIENNETIANPETFSKPIVLTKVKQSFDTVKWISSVKLSLQQMQLIY